MLNAGHVLTAKTPPSSREVSQVQLAQEIAERTMRELLRT